MTILNFTTTLFKRKMLARGSQMLSGLLFLSIALSGGAHASTFSFILESEITVPPADAPDATGIGTFTFDQEAGTVSGSVTVSGTTGQPTIAHIHVGAVGEAGPIVITLEGNEDGSVWSLPPNTELDSTTLQDFDDGLLYVNVHTEANAPGELRAQLDDSTLVMPTTLALTLDTESTVPVAVAPGASGTGSVTIDTITGAISGSVTVTGTTGQPTIAHVHVGGVGVAGPVLITMIGNDDGSEWSLPEGSILDAEGIEAFLTGNLYINVHTEANAPGELRAQLVDSDSTSTTLDLTLSPDITVPPANAPDASGTGSVTVDTTTGAISGSVTVSGTTGQPTVAHVHVGGVGVAGPILITLDSNDDGSVWTFPEGATLDAVGIDDFLNGNLYINVHTEANAPGELRVQLNSDVVAGALGLRGEVYSSSALELFWERQAAPAVAYRVEQSGASAVEVEGTSFFVQGLAANTTFDFTVTALDDAGNELVSESLQLETSDDAFSASIAVENLRGEVYSSSAIELFWDVSDAGAGSFFVISRDGVEVGLTDGRSFFEEGLSSGTTFTYIVAPQSGGDAATIDLTTQGNNSGSTGVLDLVGQVYSVSALEIFWLRVDGAVSYQVERDGSVVADVDALSFFDSGLSAGTSFTYTVRALSNDGDVIATETVDLTTLN